MPVHKDSISKTAFVIPCGKWEYIRMPFGLKNGPAVFQRLINTILADIQLFAAAAYIDDIVVFSQTFEEHLTHLEAVFKRFMEAGLTTEVKKCLLATTDCLFLGHQVGAGIIRPAEAKVEHVLKYPRPANKKAMRAFLGLANYYRRFMPVYRSMAVQLTETTRKVSSDKIEWTETQCKAFEDIKQGLSSHPVLRSPMLRKPMLRKPFILQQIHQV